jgi:DNA polymerase-3 subunit beta
MEAKKNKIVINATNFEVGIVTNCEAKVHKEGKILVDARKTYEIIKEMPEGEISIIQKDSGWVEISSGSKIIFNITGLLSEEFPSVEIEGKIKFSEINAKNTYELIKNTIYATSDDKTRETLGGILVEKQKKGLRMVATDGHRLAMADRVFTDDEDKAIQRSVIIPQKGAKEIKRMIEGLDKEKRIKIGLGEKSAVVKGEEETIVVRLIEGEFPNYKKVIPLNNQNRVVMRKDELIESLRRVALVTEEETRAVRFEVKSGGLTILSKKVGLGDAREEKGVSYSGEDVEIGLNSKYLLDVLSTIEGEEVVLEMLDGKTPVLVKEKGGDQTIAVIMPMIL